MACIENSTSLSSSAHKICIQFGYPSVIQLHITHSPKPSALIISHLNSISWLKYNFSHRLILPPLQRYFALRNCTPHWRYMITPNGTATSESLIFFDLPVLLLPPYLLYTFIICTRLVTQPKSEQTKNGRKKHKNHHFMLRVSVAI